MSGASKLSEFITDPETEHTIDVELHLRSYLRWYLPLLDQIQLLYQIHLHNQNNLILIHLAIHHLHRRHRVHHFRYQLRENRHQNRQI